jgi:hypothetical protein
MINELKIPQEVKQASGVVSGADLKTSTTSRSIFIKGRNSSCEVPTVKSCRHGTISTSPSCTKTKKYCQLKISLNYDKKKVKIEKEITTPLHESAEALEKYATLDWWTHRSQAVA